MYLPLAALVVGLVAGGYQLWRRAGARRQGAWVALGAAALLALVWGGVTYARNGVYQSDLAVWADTVRQRPDNPRAMGNLVFALGEADQYELAVAWGQRAVGQHPDDPGSYYCLAWSLSGLARQYEAANQPRQGAEAYASAISAYRAAIARYQAAIRKVPGMALSDYLAARAQLAGALAAVGRRGEAESEYRALIAAAPDLPEARASLGVLLEEDGRYAEALQYLDQAVKLKPDYGDARYSLGRLLWRLRRYPGAMAQFAAALNLGPNDAHLAYEVAWLLATTRGAPQDAGPLAVSAAEQACALTGGHNPMCLAALAAGYASVGRLSDAATTAGNARQLARQQGWAELADQISSQLQQYRAGKAYWEEHFAQPATRPASQTQPATRPQPAVPATLPARRGTGA
jgi:tetratricopeptide (TPR) repeat protein